MPRISYGPPGHRGVTTLLAVGADEYESSTDKAIRTGTLAAAGAVAAGVVAGSTFLKLGGMGALLALVAVRYAGRAPKAPAAGGQTRGAGAGSSW